MVEAITYRYRGHSKSDRNLYRTQQEIDDWRNERDPIMRFEGMAAERGLLDSDGIQRAASTAAEAIRAAIGEAYAQPDATADDLEGAAYA